MKLVFSLLVLSGCGRWNRLVTHYTGDLTYKCSKHGIEYVQSDSGLAVSYGFIANISNDETRFEPVRCTP